MHGTSEQKGSKILGVIERAIAERLLLDWANLPDAADSGHYRRLLSKYPKVFGELLPVKSRTLLSYRNRLRKAWDAHDRRLRDWYIFQLRSAFEFEKALKRSGVDLQSILDGNMDDANMRLQDLLEPPPNVSQLEAALFHLQTGIADRARYCGGPGCPAPYFIAVKRWQKYCSPECAGPATRESKRQWWRDNRAKNGGSE